jgi:hypothetical protein
MRRSLLLVLAATVALAAWSYRWTPAPTLVAAAVLPAAANTPSADVTSQRSARPDRWPEVEVAPAVGDPFSVAPPKEAPRNLPPPGPPPAPEPPPAPTAPALEHRFFGRVVGPDGRQITLLTRTGVPVAVSDGVALDDGYVVESVRPEAVRLVYPPLGTVVDLPVPPMPSEPR